MARTLPRRTAPPLVLLALLAVAVVLARAGDASAEQRWFSVRLADGTVATVEVDVPPGTPVAEIPLPGELIEELPPPAAPDPLAGHGDGQPQATGGESDGPRAGQGEQAGRDGAGPRGTRGRRQSAAGSRRPAAGRRARRPRRKVEREPARSERSERSERPERRRSGRRRAAGPPRPSAPGYFDALPGPAPVPDFAIRKFRVPVFLLPIYQAAATQYGLRWEYLAAINEIETDYGRNLSVSSAGALGWMQFMPATWRSYGVDANSDGRKDPYNPVDAIFAAARYLRAAGAPGDMRAALFAYNHADWYVDSVVLRARLIAGLPSDLVGSLTGLTESRFPVAARTRYAEDEHDRSGIDLYARPGAPAVAVADGVVRRIGHDRGGNRVVVLQDAYGNRFTYRRLATVARWHAGGAEPPGSATLIAAAAASPEPVVKRRLFAHPGRARPQRHGGADQLIGGGGRLATYDGATAAREAGPRRPLRRGSQVTAGTVLGWIGRRRASDPAHLRFEVRPAGRGAPSIDPKPILDGWKLLESTAIFRASGRNVLHGDDARVSIGQIMLLPKPLLEKRVLSDERIEIYPCGRRDVRAGVIDRRVLATLAYLAESGLRPTVTSLRCGHSYYTSSGSVSHHSTGSAVDIAAVNGVPVLGHQERGGVTDQAVDRLMALRGTMRPDQIISLLDRGANTFAMGDHDDHIHVGWRPLFGDGGRLERQPVAVLRPGQWHDLVGRLRRIDQPAVPRRPSRFALPARRSSGAHRAE